ncbi:8783_t:CDS:1 [Diversispora eburnea]|uniref:8783_t:CDS:1 n=1 Tax=Diversispora eburnea TaxID=1213867 RepID=A0A9N8ZT51_9GLOM|nr:8783_t:CDS:1 [Diversispora eburnea]
MATKIPTEILIKILNYVKSSRSTQDLYSSLLVNRIWCKVTIPILWELPLGLDLWMDYNKRKKKALCIRTYISCMDTQARNLLIQNGFDLSSSPSQATFDYPSFAHKLIINNVSVYSLQIIAPDHNNNNYDEITRSRILFHEICKLIINRCTFLNHFELVRIPFESYHDDLISSIFDLPGAPKVFEKLESFTLRSYPILFRSLFESLTLICDHILIMDLYLDLESQVIILAKLISVQKQLENLSIEVGKYLDLDCNSLFWAIISQKETLKSLRLILVNFNRVEEKNLLPIGQFISLQELSIIDCSGFHKSNCLFLASSLTQLSRFKFLHSLSEAQEYPQEFIIKILETANTNLKNICLILHSVIIFDAFSAILNYCTKINELSLQNLIPEQVIEIFNNNFNDLRRFSFNCGKIFDADELLCQMAENVPKSLETIVFMMMYKDPWIFSANSLRKFFEGWCCKGGGGNNKLIVTCLEPQLFTLSDEHFKVIEEYGVQFDVEENAYI